MIKFFGRWDGEGITVQDPGLKEYIILKLRLVPKSYGRFASSRFHKSKCSIVERLVNKVMVPGHKAKKHKASSGHITGMNIQALRIVEKAFELIEKRTKQNPLAVFSKAVENGAPREEIVAIEYGGARYPKAVECAPQRRIDLVMRFMTQGAYQKAFKKKKSISETLADEIMAAAAMKSESNTLAKKHDLERQADASR